MGVVAQAFTNGALHSAQGCDSFTSSSLCNIAKMRYSCQSSPSCSVVNCAHKEQANVSCSNERKWGWFECSDHMRIINTATGL